MNLIVLLGNLTRDIELRYAPSGTAIGSTAIAVTEKYKDSSGVTQEDVMFVDLSFFGRQAEIANQYLKKGSKISIEGKLKLNTWTDQNGQKKQKHQVTVKSMTMLDCKKDNEGTGSYNNPQNSYSQPQNSYNQPQDNHSQQQSSYSQPEIPEIDIDDDEIPF